MVLALSHDHMLNCGNKMSLDLRPAPLHPVVKIAPLLFCSGACALLYQVVWVREFRLVFGASTAASAAVLAMFMGGLGAGGVIIGKRVDKRKDPLMLYANLELGVALLAGVSPFVVDAIRYIYSALGGTMTLGMPAGTITRLLLAAVVLIPPTLLMGGTLPAAAKAAETNEDVGRSNIGLLYGVNTLGAVTGAALSSFVLLEVFGGRLLLWLGCLLNALLGLVARGIARSLAENVERSETENDAGENNDKPLEKSAEGVEEDESGDAAVDSGKEDAAGELALAKSENAAPDAHKEPSGAPANFVLAAAAVVGFTFLLMELVFYRMLGPVLGGSSYTFGMILTIALLGVGLGGAAYPVWFANRPPTISAFALTCVLEALGFAIPYALGDRIALLAISLRSLEPLGFAALVSGWFVIGAVVVLPAAFISGLQFPLLIALLGRGKQDAGRHVGLAYGWNTAGAITGSLAGGFGFLPWLTAPGVWRASALLLIALGVAAMVLSSRIEKRMNALALPTIAAIVTLMLVRTVGPTAALRHSPIGAGRADNVMRGGSINSIRDWMHAKRRSIIWEADGVESSVALSSTDGYAFVVNGKSDGHSRTDAGTQVMGGLIGAFLHPSSKKALVVGLGTGSTAGWLGAVPSMERVDVVELEPAIVRVARDCAPVNRNVLDNPKVHVFAGDAREVLITTKNRYDIIFSEPSNPYRAGIAGLFTADFYQSVAQRLEKGGMFLQWLQAYEVDGQTIRTVYSTLASVFPNVETWSTQSGDLILVATLEPVEYDPAKLRIRLQEEPFRSAAANVWRVSDLEGFFAHYLANANFTKAIAAEEHGAVSTDDRNLLEFSFARTAGRGTLFDSRQLVQLATALNHDQPELVRGPLDRARVDDEKAAMMSHYFRDLFNRRHQHTPNQQRRTMSFAAFATDDFRQAAVAWRSQPQAPVSLAEIAMLARTFAEIGDSEALAMIDKLRAHIPTEADALAAIYYIRKEQFDLGTDAAIKAFEQYRTDPWAEPAVMQRLVVLVPDIARKDKALGRRLFDALKEPFALQLQEEVRKVSRMQLASRIDFPGMCVEAVSAYEPSVPFRAGFLLKRLDCYQVNNHPLRAKANKELEEFFENEPPRFQQGLEDEIAAEDKTQPVPAAN